MHEGGFVFNVYGFYSNDYSSSAIDEEGVPALRETTVQDRSDSDGGYLIGCKRGDSSKQFVATSRSFERGSKVTEISDLHLEKHLLQSISTDAGNLNRSQATLYKCRFLNSVQFRVRFKCNRCK
jgi:hypothetical protein